MSLPRQEKKTSSINALRRQQPQAVAVAFRQRYDERTQRRGDADFPGSPATQDPAGDLSAPIHVVAVKVTLVVGSSVPPAVPGAV